jgi:hypothetical protein
MYITLVYLTNISIIVAAFLLYKKSYSALTKAAIMIIMISFLIQETEFIAGRLLSNFLPGYPLLFLIVSVVLFRFYFFRRLLADNEIGGGNPQFITVFGYFFITVPGAYIIIILNNIRKDKLIFRLFFYSILLIIGFAILYFQQNFLFALFLS